MNTVPDPQQRVAAIRGPSPTYKRDELDAVIAHREATTPLLLALLAEIAADPEVALARMGGESFDAIYTVLLLAWFREEAAHDDLVRIARLPGETFEGLLGEGFVTDALENPLLATAGPRTDGIVAILTDREADEYVRSQAASALVTAVQRGHASRDEVLALLARQLVEEAAPDAEGFFWSGMIGAMLRLHPVEHLDAIRRSFDQGLVESGMMDFSDVEDSLGGGPEEATPEDDELEDLHDRIGWWACFHEPPEVEARPPQRQVEPLPELKHRFERKLPRNGPCWCGSGRKYKGCHYKADEAR